MWGVMITSPSAWSVSVLQSTDLADNSLGGVECTAHHPGSRGVADIVSVTMPLLGKNAIFLALFKLSPHQGLQSLWLPARFTETLGLVLHRSNVKSYSLLPASSSEPPKRGLKLAISNSG